jgi:hypothetical protein
LTVLAPRTIPAETLWEMILIVRGAPVAIDRIGPQDPRSVGFAAEWFRGAITFHGVPAGTSIVRVAWFCPQDERPYECEKSQPPLAPAMPYAYEAIPRVENAPGAGRSDRARCRAIFTDRAFEHSTSRKGTQFFPERAPETRTPDRTHGVQKQVVVCGD